jgi:predicted transcriptional regulator
MATGPPFSLDDITSPSNKPLFLFLDYIDRILASTGSPYVRDLVTLDYLTTTLEMPYKEAENFLEALRDAEILVIDQHGAFPGTLLSEKGKQLLGELRGAFGQLARSASPSAQPPSKPELKTYVYGNTQTPNSGPTDRGEAFPEAVVYRFLKFHTGVATGTNPYLREMAAEGFLKDNERMSFGRANDFIKYLLDNDIVEYDQHGAFPGTRITAKGEALYKLLAKKFR